MQRIVLLAILTAMVTFSAGCVEDSEPTAPADPEDDGNMTAAPTVPEKVMGPQEAPNQDFQVSGSWAGAVDVQNAGGLAICSLPTADCHTWEFTIDATMDARAVLSWTLPINDLDLYLFQDGQELSRDGINNIGDTPVTTQTLSAPALAAGTYQLVVVPWNAVNASYTLDVAFS